MPLREHSGLLDQQNICFIIAILQKNDCHNLLMTVAMFWRFRPWSYAPRKPLESLKISQGQRSGLFAINILNAILQGFLRGDQHLSALLHNIRVAS